MPEVLDLRQFRAAQLAPLLAAETDEWRRELDWDYESSAALIRQYLEAHILPGVVWGERAPPRTQVGGYGFFVYEASKGLIGDLFVPPAQRQPDAGVERLLLENMLQTLQATPGVVRIEAQLMIYRPADLGAVFAAHGFHAHRRLFLRLDLPAPPGAPGNGAERFPDLRFESWCRRPAALGDDAAARLILAAYQNHVDGRINDQYRTFQGALRFLNNIARYPGCGAFDGETSLLARSLDGGHLAGMALVSRVRPEVAHLTQICVMPARQHRGLGAALLQEVLQRTSRAGLRAITLTVTRDNAPACTLYERLGFHCIRDFDAYTWERESA